MRPENVGHEVLLPARPRRGTRDDFSRLVDDHRGDTRRDDSPPGTVVVSAPTGPGTASVPVSQALRDLARQIMSRVDPAKSHVIVLFSPVFGRIRLFVTRKAGRISLRLQFHRADTDLLDHHAQALRAMLSAAGLTCELEVTGLGPDPGKD